MSNPLVSIIIPVYNGSNYLKEAIESALNQTYNNIEIIVVNDGSCDDGETEAIANSYGNQIRYFVKKNGGVSSALNLGIEKMKGDYFSWLSHDDLYKPEKIELEVKNIYDNSTIVMCDSIFCDSSSKILKRRLKKWKMGLLSSDMVFKMIYSGHSIAGCSLLIPKTAFKQVGLFNENYKYMQDMDMWYRMLLADYKFFVISEKLSITRIHPQQFTVIDLKNNNQSGQQDANEIGKKVVDSFIGLKKYELIKKYMYLCYRNNSLKNAKYCKNVLKIAKKMNLVILFKCCILKIYGLLRIKLVKLFYMIKLRR